MSSVSKNAFSYGLFEKNQHIDGIHYIDGAHVYLSLKNLNEDGTTLADFSDNDKSTTRLIYLLVDAMNVKGCPSDKESTNMVFSDDCGQRLPKSTIVLTTIFKTITVKPRSNSSTNSNKETVHHIPIGYLCSLYQRDPKWSIGYAIDEVIKLNGERASIHLTSGGNSFESNSVNFPHHEIIGRATYYDTVCSYLGPNALTNFQTEQNRMCTIDSDIGLEDPNNAGQPTQILTLDNALEKFKQDFTESTGLYDLIQEEGDCSVDNTQLSYDQCVYVVTHDEKKSYIKNKIELLNALKEHDGLRDYEDDEDENDEDEPNFGHNFDNNQDQMELEDNNPYHQSPFHSRNFDCVAFINKMSEKQRKFELQRLKHYDLIDRAGQGDNDQSCKFRFFPPAYPDGEYKTFAFVYDASVLTVYTLGSLTLPHLVVDFGNKRLNSIYNNGSNNKKIIETFRPDDTPLQYTKRRIAAELSLLQTQIKNKTTNETLAGYRKNNLQQYIDEMDLSSPGLPDAIYEIIDWTEKTRRKAHTETIVLTDSEMTPFSNHYTWFMEKNADVHDLGPMNQTFELILCQLMDSLRVEDDLYLNIWLRGAASIGKNFIASLIETVAIKKTVNSFNTFTLRAFDIGSNQWSNSLKVIREIPKALTDQKSDKDSVVENMLELIAKSILKRLMVEHSIGNRSGMHVVSIHHGGYLGITNKKMRGKSVNVNNALATRFREVALYGKKNRGNKVGQFGDPSRSERATQYSEFLDSKRENQKKPIKDAWNEWIRMFQPFALNVYQGGQFMNLMPHVDITVAMKIYEFAASRFPYVIKSSENNREQKSYISLCKARTILNAKMSLFDRKTSAMRDFKGGFEALTEKMAKHVVKHTVCTPDIAMFCLSTLMRELTQPYTSRIARYILKECGNWPPQFNERTGRAKLPEFANVTLSNGDKGKDRRIIKCRLPSGGLKQLARRCADSLNIYGVTEEMVIDTLTDMVHNTLNIDTAEADMTPVCCTSFWKLIRAQERQHEVKRRGVAVNLKYAARSSVLNALELESIASELEEDSQHSRERQELANSSSSSSEDPMNTEGTGNAQNNDEDDDEDDDNDSIPSMDIEANSLSLDEELDHLEPIADVVDESVRYFDMMGSSKQFILIPWRLAESSIEDDLVEFCQQCAYYYGMDASFILDIYDYERNHRMSCTRATSETVPDPKIFKPRNNKYAPSYHQTEDDLIDELLSSNDNGETSSNPNDWTRNGKKELESAIFEHFAEFDAHGLNPELYFLDAQQDKLVREMARVEKDILDKANDQARRKGVSRRFTLEDIRKKRYTNQYHITNAYVSRSPKYVDAYQTDISELVKQVETRETQKRTLSRNQLEYDEYDEYDLHQDEYYSRDVGYRPRKARRAEGVFRTKRTRW